MNALDALGEFSGLSRKTMSELLQQVKANHALLNACARHEFEAVEPTLALRSQYRCKRCGGVVDQHAWYWHQQGRR